MVFLLGAYVLSIATLEIIRGMVASGQHPERLTASMVEYYLGFLTQQMVNPFSAWNSEYVPQGTLAGLMSKAPGSFRAIASFHTMAAGTAIGLFLHAAKRRFD